MTETVSYLHRLVSDYTYPIKGDGQLHLRYYLHPQCCHEVGYLDFKQGTLHSARYGCKPWSLSLAHSWLNIFYLVYGGGLPWKNQSTSFNNETRMFTKIPWMTVCGRGHLFCFGVD